MIESTLDKYEQLYAATVGIRRMVKGGWNPNGSHGINNSTEGWQRHCDGACSECAVAKWLGVYWTGGIVGVVQQPDVGLFQVRSTPRADGSLILHTYTDLPEDVFILVLTHRAPTYLLMGWIYASEGKQKQYWREDVRCPAFFAPQSILRDMEALKMLGQRAA